MKAILFSQIKKAKIVNIDIPQIKDNEVLIKNKFVGFCGTDVHIYNGEFPAKLPLIPGHEFSGIVEKIGRNVTSLNVGDPVAINPVVSCGTCYYCKMNEQNYCSFINVYGATIAGGFAEYTAVLEGNACKINHLIDFKEAALLEPLSCAIYGVNKIKINLGDNALIFGSGAMGLIILQLLKSMGVSHITMVDINNKKESIAKNFGADEFLLNDDAINKNLKSISKPGFDIIVDATGNNKVCEQIFQYYTNNTRILLYGVCKQDAKINISPFEIYKNDLSIYGAYSFRATMPTAIKLLEKNKINLRDLITHECGLNDFESALKIVENGEAIKLIFNCSI